MKIGVVFCVTIAVLSTASSAWPQILGDRLPGYPHPAMPKAADAEYSGSLRRYAVEGAAREPKFQIRVGSPAETFISVAFSPDGKTLASASLDDKMLRSERRGSTIELWEVATGKNLAKFPAATGFFQSLAFSPDGKILASGGPDAIELWEVATGKNMAKFSGATGFVQSLAFSPDGKTLASGSLGKSMKLWDVVSGKGKAILQGHFETEFNCAVFSPDGKILAACGTRTIHGWNVATISLWDVATGKNIANFSSYGDQFTFSALAFSPDGKTLVSGRGDGAIKLWDVATGRNIVTIIGHASCVLSLEFSPDGKAVASGSGDETIKLWNTVTGKNIATLKGPAFYGWPMRSRPNDQALAFTPDGKTLVAAGCDGTIRLWDVRAVAEAGK
ncbi:MAG: WD40 repeat domain-containing protein [Thermoguttaceae bacterium]